ncbi:HAD family hydrolase, partial [Candidatus Bipolaricaulota bacterium]
AAMQLDKKLESVIWDFNGTLIDDLDHVVCSVNVQLVNRNLPQLTRATYRSVFGFPVEDYYRRIGFDLETDSMADLSAEFFSTYGPGLRNCSLHRGVLDTLQRFKLLQLRQFVLSAMEQEMLQAMVEHLEIDVYFNGVYGLAHLEGDSKVSRGRDLLRDFDVEPNTALLIGDTDHDAEVADTLHLSAALVSQGHQSHERLRATNHDVSRSLQELTQKLAQQPTRPGPIG